MEFPDWTYQDIAERIKVHPRVISRWVNRLEKAKKLKPFRPTRGTVRLTDSQVSLLLTLHYGRITS